MIKDNLLNIKSGLPQNVQLVAVSKTKPVSDVVEAYETGQRIFGENYPQELAEKYPQLPKDIQWHFIGHMQTNKIKMIAPFVSMIHAIDSLHLLQAIDKKAVKNNRTINCLLQFHIAEEETKFGLDLDEAKQLLESEEYKNLKNIRICGVMGMATNTDNKDQVRREFRNLKSYFDYLKTNYFGGCDYFKELSMGMSEDYPIAIEEGATLVRIGSRIFGARNYSSKQ